jgi:hypothetical protein
VSLEFPIKFPAQTGPLAEAANKVKSLRRELTGLQQEVKKVEAQQAKSKSAGLTGGIPKAEVARAAKEQRERLAAEKKFAREQEKIAKSNENARKVALRKQEVEEKRADRERLKAQVAREKEEKRLAKRSPLQIAEDTVKNMPQNMTAKHMNLNPKQVEQYKHFLREAKMSLDGLVTSKKQLGAADVVDLAALHRVNKEIQQQKNRLGEIQRVLILSGNAAKFGREGTNRLTTTLRELAEAAGSSGISNMAGRLVQNADGAKQFAVAFQGVGSALGAATGIGTKAGMMLTGLGIAAGGAIVTVVALTGAVAALGAGLAILGAKGAMFGLRAGEARQASLGMLEAMLGTRKAAVVAHVDMQNLLRDFDTTPEKLKEMSTAFTTAGMRSTKMLRDSMTAVVKTSSVLGEQAASKLQGIFEEAARPKFVGTFGGMEGMQRMVINAQTLQGTGLRLKEVWTELAKRSGQSFEEVARYMHMGLGIESKKAIEAIGAVVEQKFGKQALKAALKFDVQINALRMNLKRMFNAVDASPIMANFAKIVQMFDQSTVAGAVLKGMVTEFYNGLFRLADKAIPYVQTAMDGFVNIALKTYIGFRPLLTQLGIIGPTFDEGIPIMTKFENVLMGIGDTAGKLAADLSTIVMKVVALNDWMKKMTGGKVVHQVGTEKGPDGKERKVTRSTVQGGSGLGTALKYGISPATIAADYSIGSVKAGKEVAKGLAKGIVDNAPEVAKAVKFVVDGAIGFFKDDFQIKSPSKVTEGIGRNVTLGLAQGIKKDAKAVNDNLAGVVNLRNIGGQSSVSVGSGAGGSTIVVNLNVEKIEIHGGSAEEVLSMLETEMEELMSNAMEKAAAMQGLRATG